ncbi:MAG: hypothetical protein EP329_11355 [Deltaproteobacteria bacterium]|nr:MAG: hypothetical protein EP329_11355 [Deltaproteobacteria bacterium]
MTPTHLRSLLRLALALAVPLSACADAGPGAPGDDTREDDVADAIDLDTREVDASGDTVDPTAPRWHVALEDLGAALLSVSGEGPDDLWLTGADKGDGPLVVRGHGGTWTRIDLRAADPEGGHLWWSAAPDAAGRYFVGEGGRVLRWDAGTGAVARVPVDTDATLYGVWGASQDEIWAVGGYVHPRSGPPTVVRVRNGEGRAVVDLPAGLGAETTLFKVWGSAADDVWVVGEAGTVLHWDGGGWTLDALPGAPRLVTVHGASASDMVAVGGASQALIFERSDGAWRDASPGPYSLLNGVYVAPDGAAIAVGVLGQTFHRRDGVWTSDADLPLYRDWHAAWIDPRGDAWVVGGRLLSASTFDSGTVLRFGPDRDDLPSGDVVPFEVDVVEPDADVVEPDADVVEDTAVPEDTVAVEVVEDIGPVDTVAEDTAADDAAPDADTAAPEPDLSLGRIAGVTDFTAFTPGEAVEIVQGPQGGIHVEIGVRFPWPGVTAPSAGLGACDEATEVEQAVASCGQCPCTAVTAIAARSFVDGAEVGAYVTTGYPVSLLAPGVYQTYAIPVIFYTVDAAPFVGKTVEIRVDVTLPDGEARQTAATLTLRDDF